MYNRQYNRMPEYERHIRNEEQYRDAIRNLRKGEHWRMDDLIARSDVNFNEEQFTPYDYSYMVNAHKSDYPDISEKPDQYMRMAKEYLHNDSFPERGDERAYYDAQRRARRYNYNNEYSNNYNRLDDYNRNEYSYRQNERYAERNTYRDRDNDGRYRE